jgi:hypothetical protein
MALPRFNIKALSTEREGVQLSPARAAVAAAAAAASEEAAPTASIRTAAKSSTVFTVPGEPPRPRRRPRRSAWRRCASTPTPFSN